MQKDELQLFIDYLKSERNYSDKTISAYQTDLLKAKSFWQENGGFDGWTTIQSRDIEVYLQYIADNDNLSRSSQTRKMSALRSFYRFLTRRHIVKVDPTQTIALKKGERRLPEFFYSQEIAKVIDSLSGSDPLSQRNLALFELLYATGMRLNEVANLKVKQIDLDTTTILVHGKGNKDRIVVFDSNTKRDLENYLNDGRKKLLVLANDPTEYVFLNRFGRKISNRGIESTMQRVFNKAGIAGKVHPHELRHSFATAMIHNGADLRTVQELLGHSNLSTTQIYTHVTMAHLQDEYDKFFNQKRKENK
ncbi:tyrosine recombinase XerC [Lactobacillus pasteurii DSM 23907 = CRBIP 24.76]|uniref:Tyrosine recombinase XerC n=2 Tax=Lactobacillus pasteurii TaxID=872327 RepID=I7LBG0_9LACO|nr:tyrosine recombinase XerC [Lactobacillus pasteurii DSM 23907 = CRBIP 24.76]TDG75771.1 hypothetical protein C5L33_000656 [Lactobacillus pasteurii]CCI85546.1 Tyrosine recombinase xerC [Lactobacillus pasteurii DSM 23907 = CRBIP 24.76]